MVEKRDNFEKGVIGAVGGTAAASGVAPRLLGYHVVRHGTSNENAAKIKKEGFNPKMGGKGGAGQHAASGDRAKMFKEQSKGKIHVTKNPAISRMFAGMTENRNPNPQSLGDLAGGKVLKARVTDQHYRTMQKDPHMGGNKANAATTHHKIPAHQIIGGAGDKGVKGVVNKKTLAKYYRNKANHGRIGRGVALAGIAAAGAHQAYQSVKEGLTKKSGLQIRAESLLR